MNGESGPIAREMLIALWKVHILHHAAERPVYGLWIAEELARHGHRISPGTLYPLLRRMEARGWIAAREPAHGGAHARRSYVLTAKGEDVLAILRDHVAELYDEVCRGRRARIAGRPARGRSDARRS